LLSSRRSSWNSSWPDLGAAYFATSGSVPFTNCHVCFVEQSFSLLGLEYIRPHFPLLIRAYCCLSELISCFAFTLRMEAICSPNNFVLSYIYTASHSRRSHSSYSFGLENVRSNMFYTCTGVTRRRCQRLDYVASSSRAPAEWRLGQDLEENG
jgi:hypothetical protein